MLADLLFSVDGIAQTNLSRIANLLNDVMNLVNGEVDDFLFHPLRELEFLDELSLDISNNLITELLSFFRECFLNEESAQDPTKAIINVPNTCSPPFRRRFRVLLGLISTSLHIPRQIAILDLAAHS